MCLLLILLREGLVGFVGSRRGEGCTGWTGRGVVGARRGEARSGRSVTGRSSIGGFS